MSTKCQYRPVFSRRANISSTDRPVHREVDHERDDDAAHQDVKPVQARHDIVEPEKEDLAAAHLQKDRRVRVDADVDLGRPLEILDHEKGNAHDDRHELQPRRKEPLPPPDGRDGQGDAEAAGEQDGRVHGAQQEVFLGGGGVKGLGVAVAEDGIEQEHPPEKEDLREEEEPHPDLLPGGVDGFRLPCSRGYLAFSSS